MQIDKINIHTAQEKDSSQRLSPEKSQGSGSFQKALDNAARDTYHISKGDTLWHIVKTRLIEHGCRPDNHMIARGVRLLADWNCIRNPDLIYAGHYLDLAPLGDFAAAYLTGQPSLSRETAAEGDTQKTSVPPVHEGAQPPAPPETVARQKEEPPKPPESQPPHATFGRQIARYRHEQLLAAPGGKLYEIEPDRVTLQTPEAYHSLQARVSKDIADSLKNMAELSRDITSGSRSHYTAPDGTIQSRQKPGLLGTMKKFLQNMASGLSLGAYRPDGEQEPAGAERLKFLGKKIFNDALLHDLGAGVPSAVASGMRHAALAAWNALEAVPDAVAGNIEAGRKVTNTVFDNGQVVVSYITDVMPGGDAWFRVHAPGSSDAGWSVPVYFNLKTTEQGIQDPRWQTVSNTPFRKTIETIGSLLADNAILGLFGKNPINTVPQTPGRKD